MSIVKRERWTEAEIAALPVGEHDYFERKSGQLFSNIDELLGKLAKTVSAMANSGGGHIILGVNDQGVPDGVPVLQGGTPVREWLEQKIPHLVQYPLADLRVHVVEPSDSSRIPLGKQVIVIDIGDSALAPHQCVYSRGGANKYIYYYRQGGRSEPAPHFHLELLRQRLVNPVLEAMLTKVEPVMAVRLHERVFLATHLYFQVRNIGRVAAYKWQLILTEMAGYPENRESDYCFNVREYPEECRPSKGGLRLDNTILPGCNLEENQDFGVWLQPAALNAESIKSEIEALFLRITLGYRLATETSPGKLEHMQLCTATNVETLTTFILQKILS